MHSYKVQALAHDSKQGIVVNKNKLITIPFTFFLPQNQKGKKSD